MHPTIIKTRILIEELRKTFSRCFSAENLKIFWNWNPSLKFIVNQKDIKSHTFYHFLLILTIISITKYFLKSKFDSATIALEGRCIQGKTFDCPNQLRSNYHPSSCKTNVLLHESTDCCQFTRLEITKCLVEFVPELTQFIGSSLPSKRKFEDSVEGQNGIKSFKRRVSNSFMFYVLFQANQSIQKKIHQRQSLRGCSILQSYKFAALQFLQFVQ